MPGGDAIDVRNRDAVASVVQQTNRCGHRAMTELPGQAFALFDRGRLMRILDGAEDASPHEAQVLVRMAASISIYGDKASAAGAEEIRALADRIPYNTAIDLCRYHLSGLDAREVPGLRHAVEDILNRWCPNASATRDEGATTSLTKLTDDDD